MIRPIFLLSLAYFSFVFSADNVDAVATEQTATELKYGVYVYECDGDLYGLPEPRKKEFGKVYRVCFEPNVAATNAGVAIKKIESFKWFTGYKTGEAHQTAVLDGKAEGGLSLFEPSEDGKKYYLDTYFGVDFYHNEFSVEGSGEVSMTSGTGTVPAKIALFHSKFTVVFKNEDGTEKTPEETSEMMENVSKHNEAVKQKQEEDQDTVEDGKEEL
mmetsp:Transcript_13343/g.31201  ORF Transcript_13343/g.31201 Transcript_13343/m.31201 type:complete len:215 (+) Transcript_13343:116-760(+)